MSNRFLISVAAAALIAGTGFANAQGTGMGREAPSGGSAAQQSAPSSDRGGAAGGAMQRDDHGKSGMKGAESEKSMKGAESEKSPGADKSQRAEDKMKGGKDMKAEGKEDRGGMKGEKSQTTGQGTTQRDQSTTQQRDQTTTQGRDQTTTQKDQKAQGQQDRTQTQTQGGAAGQSTTTGNAATSATAAPPAEKRTQIVSAIRSEKIQETTNVNFNISVGATVPTTVRFHPLPARIVEIYPEWRGYEVILVKGRYIIVRPRTHEIVYIIEG